MAVLGTQGFEALPKHCLTMCLGAFLIAFAVAVLRDQLPERWARFVPIPMACALPFYLGAYIAVDMTLGTVVKAIWQLSNFDGQAAFGMVAASVRLNLDVP